MKTTALSRINLIALTLLLSAVSSSGVAADAPSTNIPAASPTPAPTTYLVKEGEFPWADRMNVWQLADIPASVAGNGPLPIQNCGKRGLDLPADTKSILLAVATKDEDKFKVAFPTATPTGETLSVVHTDGTGKIPYTIFKLANPTTVSESDLTAGMLLLQINDKPTSK